MASEKFELNNGYVVYVDSSKGKFIVKSVRFVDSDRVEKDCIGVEIPQNSLYREELTDYIDKLKMCRSYRLSPIEMIRNIASYTEIEMILKSDFTFQIASGDDICCITSVKDDMFDIEVFVMDNDVSISTTLNKYEYFNVLAYILRKWSKNNLRVNSR